MPESSPTSGQRSAPRIIQDKAIVKADEHRASGTAGGSAAIFCYNQNMSSLFTLEQLQWIHEHALLLSILTVAAIGAVLFILVFWIDGGTDDSMADTSFLGDGSGH